MWASSHSLTPFSSITLSPLPPTTTNAICRIVLQFIIFPIILHLLLLIKIIIDNSFQRIQPNSIAIFGGIRNIVCVIAIGVVLKVVGVVVGRGGGFSGSIPSFATIGTCSRLLGASCGASHCFVPCFSSLGCGSYHFCLLSRVVWCDVYYFLLQCLLNYVLRARPSSIYIPVVCACVRVGGCGWVGWLVVVGTQAIAEKQPRLPSDGTRPPRTNHR